MKRLKADQFSLPYQVVGNPKGTPLLFLHGGPGYAATEDDIEKFDLKTFKIILFQQRGAVLSGLPGETKSNTTQHLIEDIENLRKELGIESWAVYGQSWGTFLALCYAIKYPIRVEHLFLKGVFLGRKEDINWLYSESKLGNYNDEMKKRFDDLRKSLNIEHKDSILEDFAKEVLKENPNIEACVDWTRWEDINCGSETEPTIYPEIDDTYKKIAYAMARMETFYFINNCFVEENYIIDNLALIKSPISIFHGEFDRICPKNQADALYNRAKELNIEVDFYLTLNCGHSSNKEMEETINSVTKSKYPSKGILSKIQSWIAS